MASNRTHVVFGALVIVIGVIQTSPMAHALDVNLNSDPLCTAAGCDHTFSFEGGDPKPPPLGTRTLDDKKPPVPKTADGQQAIAGPGAASIVDPVSGIGVLIGEETNQDTVDMKPERRGNGVSVGGGGTATADEAPPTSADGHSEEKTYMKTALAALKGAGDLLGVVASTLVDTSNDNHGETTDEAKQKLNAASTAVAAAIAVTKDTIERAPDIHTKFGAVLAPTFQAAAAPTALVIAPEKPAIKAEIAAVAKDQKQVAAFSGGDESIRFFGDRGPAESLGEVDAPGQGRVPNGWKAFTPGADQDFDNGKLSLFERASRQYKSWNKKNQGWLH